MTIDINMIHFFAFIALIIYCVTAIKDNAKEITGYKGHNFREYVFKIKCKIILRFAFIITFAVILYQSLFYVFWYIEQFLKNITCNI